MANSTHFISHGINVANVFLTNTSQFAFGSNVVVTFSSLTIGNSTVNTFANSSRLSTGQINVGSNVSLSPTTLLIGNSTVNTTVNSSVVALNGSSLTVIFEPLGAFTNTNVQSGTSYTFVLSDKGSVVEGNSGSSTTFTVPNNASVAFPVKTYINVTQIGAGQITISAGTGVTLRSRNGLKLAGQYAVATLYKRATDEWVVGGDITA